MLQLAVIAGHVIVVGVAVVVAASVVFAACSCSVT